MNELGFYFKLGWEHIISWDALDHLLFVFALTCVFLIQDWKKLLVLVTAFTIGHSLTLALSVLDVIRFNSHVVEILIPVTIIITAFFNFFKKDNQKSIKLQYLMALLFGLIHGMGFANTIRFMLVKSQSILVPLLGFNLGLEAGQIIVVVALMLISYLLINIIKLNRNWWVWGISTIALIVAVNMCYDRLFE